MKLSITDNDKRHLIRRLQQFVLNRDSNDIREELYEYMVIEVIFLHAGKEKTLDWNKIKKFLEDEFHLSEIPQFHVDDAINRLIVKKFVLKNNRILSLSNEKWEKFDRSFKEVETIESKVKDEIRKFSQKFIPEAKKSDIDIIVDNFTNLLGSIFEKHGLEVAKIFVEEQRTKKYKSFTEFYKNEILKKIPKTYHESIDKMFYEIFSNPSKTLSQYLYSTAQSFVLSQILNVDPLLQKLEKISWSKKRVYLDTNILINLLFGGSPGVESIQNLIENTIDLKAKIFISRKTSDEFKRWLVKRKQKYRRYRVPSPKLASALGKLKNDDPFLTIYASDLASNSSLKIETFCKKYENFEDIIKNKFSILIEENIDSIEQSQKIQELKEKILKFATHGKSQNVALHDAYSILRIRQLRSTKPSDETGPSTWFLSTDSSLELAENEFFAEKNEISSSVTADQWFHIISNFLSPTSSSEKTSVAFVKLLSSHFDSHALNAEDYLNFVDVIIDDSEFSLEQLQRIVGNDYIKEKLQKIGRKKDDGIEPSSDEIQNVVSDMQKISRGEFERELTKIKSEHKDEIQKISTKIDLAIKQIGLTKTRWIIISSIIGLTLVCFIIDLTLFAKNFQTMDSTLPAILSFNVALVVGVPKLIHLIIKPK